MSRVLWAHHTRVSSQSLLKCVTPPPLLLLPGSLHGSMAAPGGLNWTLWLSGKRERKKEKKKKKDEAVSCFLPVLQSGSPPGYLKWQPHWSLSHNSLQWRRAINNTGITDGATLNSHFKTHFLSPPSLVFSHFRGLYQASHRFASKETKGWVAQIQSDSTEQKTDRSFKMPRSARLFLNARRNTLRCRCRRGDNQCTPSHVSFHNCRGKLFFLFITQLLLTHTSPPCCGFRWELIAGPSPADRRHAGYWVRLVTVERLC